MSIKSYQRNVERKVAGPELPVCFPASLEQVSPGHTYRPSVYTNYMEFIDWYDELSHEERKTPENLAEYNEMIETLVRPLGGLALEDIIFKKVTTYLGLARAINQLIAEDCRIVIDVRYGNYNPLMSAHSVGVVPVQPGFVTLVSTHVPKKLAGVIPIDTLANALAVTDERRNSVNPAQTANMVGIPNVA